MSTPKIRRLSIATAFALTTGSIAPLLAQGMATVIPFTDSQGMFTGHPVGLQLREQWQPTSSSSFPRMLIRSAGVETGALRPWEPAAFGAASAEHPDYSPRALYAHWVTTLYGIPLLDWDEEDPEHVPVLGGMSTGGDICPRIDADGKMIMGLPENVAWYSLSFTVRSDALGTAGSAFEAARAEEANPSGRIYSYIAEGSQNLRPDLIDTVRVEYTRAQLKLTGAIEGTSEVSALDWGMGRISSTPGASTTHLQPQRNSFYFTIDQSWIEALALTCSNCQFLGQSDSSQQATPVWLTPDPATVYVMSWNGTIWSQPMVAFDHVDLFGSTQTGAAIDALSVYQLASDLPETPTRVVFSLEPESRVNGAVVDQILVSQRPGSAMPPVRAKPLKTAADVKLTDKVGLADDAPTGPDDIDSLCGQDPRELQGYDLHVGYPVVTTNTSLAPEMGFSFLRYHRIDSIGKHIDTLLFQASGIDLSGYDFGAIQFDIEDFKGPSLPSSIKFAAAASSEMIVVFPQETTKELQVNVSSTVGIELRARARLHGVIFSPFQVDLDIAESWVDTIAL